MSKWAKRSKLAAAGALVFGATTALAGQITLYEGQDFQGHYVTTNDSVAIVGSPAFANAASSMVVTEGTWEACTDAYFHGRCVQLPPGTYPRVSVTLNGSIASVRQVEYATRAAPAIARPAIISPQPVVVDASPVIVNPPPVIVNPTAVVVSPPEVVVSRAPGTNAPTVVVNPAATLITPPAATVITSQPAVVVPSQVVAVAPPTGRVVLYEYPNFGGARAVVDRRQAKDLDWANFSYGRRATSIRVESGSWMLCSEMTFQGDCRIFGPGEYPQLSGPLVAGISSAKQVWRPEYGALNVYSR